MNWTPVDPENPPETKVLALGFQNEMVVGYLSFSRSGVKCEGEDALLEEVTAYITTKDLVNAAKGQGVNWGLAGDF